MLEEGLEDDTFLAKNTEDWPEESPPTLWGEEKVKIGNYLPPQLAWKTPGLATIWGSAPPQRPLLPAQLISDTPSTNIQATGLLKTTIHTHTAHIMYAYSFYFIKIK